MFEFQRIFTLPIVIWAFFVLFAPSHWRPIILLLGVLLITVAVIVVIMGDIFKARVPGKSNDIPVMNQGAEIRARFKVETVSNLLGQAVLDGAVISGVIERFMIYKTNRGDLFVKSIAVVNDKNFNAQCCDSNSGKVIVFLTGPNKQACAEMTNGMEIEFTAPTEVSTRFCKPNFSIYSLIMILAVLGFAMHVIEQQNPELFLSIKHFIGLK